MSEEAVQNKLKEFERAFYNDDYYKEVELYNYLSKA